MVASKRLQRLELADPVQKEFVMPAGLECDELNSVVSVFLKETVFVYLQEDAFQKILVLE